MPGTPILLKGPCAEILVESARSAGPPNGIGPKDVTPLQPVTSPNTNLGDGKPTSLVSNGCLKLPPPTIANCCDRRKGYEFCWPLRYRLLSAYPAVSELPTAR